MSKQEIDDYYGQEIDKSPNPGEKKRKRGKSSKKKKDGFSDSMKKRIRDDEFDYKGEY